MLSEVRQLSHVPKVGWLRQGPIGTRVGSKGGNQYLTLPAPTPLWPPLPLPFLSGKSWKVDPKRQTCRFDTCWSQRRNTWSAVWPSLNPTRSNKANRNGGKVRQILSALTTQDLESGLWCRGEHDRASALGLCLQLTSELSHWMRRVCHD